MSASDNVKWVRLGDLIEPLERRNTNKEFDISSVRGISNTKEIMATKAGVDEKVIHKFYVIRYGEFIYNPRTTRMGEKVGLGYNNTDTTYLFSFNNLAFKIKDSAKELIIPDYLFVNFKREHFDRFARTNSWGSATELFLFSDLCTFQIPLPSIEVQQELVDIYNGLKSLTEQNEALVESLSMVCEAMVIDCKNKYSKVNLGDYIEETFEQNVNEQYTLDDVRGVSIHKEFISTKANMDNVPLAKYKVVHNDMFVFNVNTARMGDKFAIALCKGNNYLVSSIYGVFSVKNKNLLLPEYLLTIFKRDEFDRYVRFNSWGSARETFTLAEMSNIKIALPPIEVQQAIVNIFNCLEEAKKIASKAREQLKTLCPALVQRAANT